MFGSCAITCRLIQISKCSFCDATDIWCCKFDVCNSALRTCITTKAFALPGRDIEHRWSRDLHSLGCCTSDWLTSPCTRRVLPREHGVRPPDGAEWRPHGYFQVNGSARYDCRSSGGFTRMREGEVPAQQFRRHTRL